MACGAKPPNDAHHIKTRGSGGGDYDYNICSLCRACHSNLHSQGILTFIHRNPDFAVRLEKMGWEWGDGRLFNEALVDSNKK